MKKGAFNFLIVGSGRGGTSLLCGLLDAHPELEVGAELFSIDCLMGLGLTKAAIDIKPNLAEERIQEFCLNCSEEAKKYQKKYWGNKITTEQIYGLEDQLIVNPGSIDALDTFFNRFLKGVKIIFISRDGRTNVRSKMARTGQSVEHACARWKYSVRISRFLQERKENCHIIKFEDLVRNPGNTLSSLCNFLEIPFTEEMFTGVSSKKMLPEYRKDTIDLSALTMKGIPEQCLPLLLPELYETRYIGKLQYILYQFRYSKIFFNLLVGSLFIQCAVIVLLLMR